MSPPPAYATEYADHRAASRVAVAARHYKYMERLVPADRHPLPPSPESVLIDPHDVRWVIGYADRALVVDAGGTHTRFAGAGRWIPGIDPDGVRVGNRVWPAGAAEYRELRPFGLFDTSAVQLAARRHDDLWIAATLGRPAFGPVEVRVIVRANDARIDDDTAPRWRHTQAGEGVATIADDDTIAIATDDRHVRMLRHPNDPQLRAPAIVGDVELEHEPYSLCAIDGGFVVVSAIEAAPAEARIARLYTRGARTFRAEWSSDVRWLDVTGRALWTARVPFAVLQPPVDLGAGRIAVAGRGLACIEGGRVVWTKPAANVDVYATAFVDGTLAVGIGSRLAILSRDGDMLRSIDVPDGMRIVTPPAIGPDGSLAFGTTGHTFVVPALDA